MSLISTNCTNCGAPIQVDSDSKTGKCEFCGSEFTTQDIVNNYQINNNYSTVQYVTKNINGSSALEAEEYIKNGDIFISLSDFNKAKEAYSKAIELNPADCFAWFGLVKVAAKNFTDLEDITHYDYYAKAKKVASREQQEKIDEIYLPYQTKRNQLEKDRRLELERIENEKQQQLKKKKRRKNIRLLIICCACLIFLICYMVSFATNNLSLFRICSIILIFGVISVSIICIFGAIYYSNKNKKK